MRLMLRNPTVPDVVVLLDVDLVKHHVLLLGVYISFHLHGNVAGKHREQETFLWRNAEEKEEVQRNKTDNVKRHMDDLQRGGGVTSGGPEEKKAPVLLASISLIFIISV